ncbi:hypothetical protein, partial [Ferrovum myxofaciens]|uniref:hypothetical protein n=1 Tax=Ferrovum myxofaciens TaxID=416213 RepID=UPI001F3F5DCB
CRYNLWRSRGGIATPSVDFVGRPGFFFVTVTESMSVSFFFATVTDSSYRNDCELSRSQKISKNK